MTANVSYHLRTRVGRSSQLASRRTRWHRLLAKLLELLLTPVGITVQAEIPITSEPPKVDIVLLRRNNEQWNPVQLSVLCDGLRQATAANLLIEFKVTESLNGNALLQALSYDYFFRQSQQLQNDEVQTFVMVARTPRNTVLEQYGYRTTALAGIYRSPLPLLERVTVIVLNQLELIEHNAFVQTFASKRRIRENAFEHLDRMAGEQLSARLVELVTGLRSQFEIQEANMEKDILAEGWTPDLLMQLGRNVRKAVAESLTPEERRAIIRSLNPREILANMAPEEILESLTPEDRVAGLAPEDRMAGLSKKELTRLLHQIEHMLEEPENGSESELV